MSDLPCSTLVFELLSSIFAGAKMLLHFAVTLQMLQLFTARSFFYDVGVQK